jgi:hypothetical protein
MLLGAPDDGVAVIVRGYVPAGVMPLAPFGGPAQAAPKRATSAKNASGIPSFSRRLGSAAAIPKSDIAASSAITQTAITLPPGPFPGRPDDGGVVPVQNVFTAMAVCVVDVLVTCAVPGITLHVIEATGLEHVSVTVPVKPVEVSTSGNTAVPPGFTVAVVPPPGPGDIVTG